VQIKTAILNKLVTDNGLMEFKEDKVFIGKVYSVDIDTRRVLGMHNTDTGIDWEGEFVWDIKEKAWLPTECLTIKE
jgi:hypothetical protein